MAIVSYCLLLGCGSSDHLVPLSVGKKWDYRFRWGVRQETGKLEVVREVPVANGTGWELRSPMGVSRLGYEGDRLVATQLGDAFLVPPLPIGLPVGKKTTWQGWITTHAGKKAAKASIAAESDKQKIAGRTRTLNKTVVQLKTESTSTELATWYAPGDGIVLQEQVSNGKVALAVTRVSG
ncbi:hypothetical protein EON82_08180 [bacterium]|nr:MAG: hypothetical protein EON82_08180 [bacterium]